MCFQRPRFCAAFLFGSCQMNNIEYRLATSDDLNGISALLMQSYPVLLRHDYSAETLSAVLPIITRARPELAASGTYWLAVIGDQIVGAGGWTQSAPTGIGSAPNVGHVRHLATHPDMVRRGVARGLMMRAMAQARAGAILHLECLSTRTAVPFYAALGFRVVGPADVMLAGGTKMPSVQMQCDL